MRSTHPAIILKMFKKLLPFGLYWHYLIDILLTHVFVIAFLYDGYAIIAALLISIDSIFKIIFSVFISRFIAQLPFWMRRRLSAIIRISLIILWFLAVNQILKNKDFLSTSIFTSFLLFKILLLLDTYCSAEFIFNLRDYFHVDLSQNAAAQNIFVRGSTAIAPALALLLLSTSHLVWIIFICALILSIVSIFFFRRIYFSSVGTSTTLHKTSYVSFTKLFAHPLARWGFAYQVLGNLSFAGVAFLLLALLKTHTNILLNEITFLYSAFLATQFFVLIFGEQVIPIKTTTGIGLTLGICGLFVLLVSFTAPGSLRLLSCSGVGFTYSFALSAIPIVLTAKLQGSGYIEFVGWSQMLGRLASFVATSLLGLALHVGVSPLLLLATCGLLGMISAVVLVWLDNPNPYK